MDLIAERLCSFSVEPTDVLPTPEVPSSALSWRRPHVALDPSWLGVQDQVEF